MTIHHIIQQIRRYRDEAMELRVKSERQRDTAGSYRATRAEGLIEAYREMLRILDPLARREAGEERCEGCGAWAPLEVMHARRDGAWLCGGCNSIQESAQHLKVTP